MPRLTPIKFLKTEDMPSLVESDMLLIDVPKALSRKSDLLSWYAKTLKFPDYFGYNWDALDECLRDLSWIDEHRIIINHHDIPLTGTLSDQKIYIEVLIVALEGSAREVIVVFPPAFKPELQRLMR